METRGLRSKTQIGMRIAHLRNYKVSNEEIRIPLSTLHFAQSYWGKQGPLALALMLSVLSRILLSPKSVSSADMWGHVGDLGVTRCAAGKPSLVSVRILFTREIKLAPCYNRHQTDALNVFVNVYRLTPMS